MKKNKRLFLITASTVFILSACSLKNKENDEYVITTETQVDDDKLFLEDEMVASSNFIEIDDGEIQTDDYVYVSTDLNFRSDKSITDNIIDCIDAAEKIYRISTDDVWDKVVYNDQVGYVKSNYTLEVPSDYVEVDISDQTLYLYLNGELEFSCDVVTGTPGKNESDKGCFKIYDITTNRYLIGEGYKSYVDVMMKYNGGEGLHDAEYHTNDDGKSHGWRSIDEFGGDTYLTHGSHGCINMPHDAAIKVYEKVKIGTDVIVHK